jgi:pSer/pThr/pTyr-binding forkhead associated (FHA) protein
LATGVNASAETAQGARWKTEKIPAQLPDRQSVPAASPTPARPAKPAPQPASKNLDTDAFKETDPVRSADRAAGSREPAPDESGSQDSINLDLIENRKAAKSDDSAIIFRPSLRTPMAVLRIYDDDGVHYEEKRIRVRETIIGRADGDVIIPNDRMMSGRHAAITCRFVDQAYRWFLTDLDSTNGTFVKASSCVLEHNSVVILGMHRYRFNMAPKGAIAVDQEIDLENMQTMGWKSVESKAPKQPNSTLIRITPEGEAGTYELAGKHVRIGSDPQQCHLMISDDPMLGSVHATMTLDEYHRWHLKDESSRNGIWLSVSERRLDGNCKFQLGEQRFAIRFP